MDAAEPNAPAPVDPAPPLATAVRELLPSPPARLALVDPGDPDLADLVREIRADGHRILRIGDAGDGSEGWDAILLRTGPKPDPEVLEAARSGIRADGRLLLLPERSPHASRVAAEELRAALSTSRWVVLEERTCRGPGGDATVLVARPGEHRIRAFRDGDEAAILELFESAFHHRRSLARWAWAYRENPWDGGRISLAQAPDGGLAAHYAGYPIPFWTDLDGPGRVVQTHHVGDTMTSPEARRVGRGRTHLLFRTAQHFFATWCHGKIAFCYGTNTGKIQRFSQRVIGGRVVEPITFRVRDPGPPIPAPGRLRRLFGGWTVEPVDLRALDEEWDRFWERVRPAYRFLVARDRRYLAWRFRCPDVRYATRAVRRRGRLVGWSVFRPEENRLVWGDALFDPAFPEAPGLLLADLVAEIDPGARSTVEGWFSDRPGWWSRILADLGFRTAPEPQDLGLIYVPFEEEPGRAMGAHLYYTKADFDLF